MNLDQLSPFCKTMHYCVGNVSEDKNKPEYKVFRVYPTYPWKFDGTDHSNDDARFFYQSCERAGLAKHMRQVEEKVQAEPPTTYTDWLSKHENEDGFVNNMVGDVVHGLPEDS